MSRHTAARVIALVLGLGAFAAAPVAADTPAAAADDDNWHFFVAPWFWTAGTSGTVSVRGVAEVPLEMSFGDVLDNFDFGLQAHFEARRRRFGLGTDLLYLNLGVPVAEGQPVLDRLDLKVDLRQTILEGFGFYRVARGGSRPSNPAYADVLVGLRYFSARTRLAGDEFEGTERTVEWVDALIGLRGVVPLGDKFSLLGRADVAFLGSVTWNLNADLRWHLSDHWVVGLGARKSVV